MANWGRAAVVREKKSIILLEHTVGVIFFFALNYNSFYNYQYFAQEAPYKPSILFDTDTSNFDPIDPEKLRPDDETEEPPDDNNRDYHGFYEFTFRRFFDDAGHPYTPPPASAPVQPPATSVAAYNGGLPRTDDNENPSGPVYV